MIQLEQVGTKHFKHESVRGEIQVQYSHDILRKWVFPFKYLLLPTYSFAYFQKQFAFVICHELYLKTQRMNKMSVNHFCLFSSFKLFFLFTGIREEGKKPKPSQLEHPFLFIRIKKRLKNQFFFYLCFKIPIQQCPDMHTPLLCQPPPLTLLSMTAQHQLPVGGRTFAFRHADSFKQAQSC